MKVKTFNVKAKSENPTKTVVEAGNFKIVIDEPENIGGTNHGPTPVEFVLAALAGCINVVGHMIANEMGFVLNGLSMDFEGDLNAAKFSGQQTTERAGFSEIRVKITPDTDADINTLNNWLQQVEERCPVGDNLKNATPVKISL